MVPVPAYASASLYVGDLAPEVTEAILFEVFSQAGPVASIRVCRDAMTRRSLGYAYVNYHSLVDAERALDTLNYTPVKAKNLRIMWSHRDPAVRKSGEANVYIKNLDKTIDHKALYDTFSSFGNILSCKVSVDEKANSKGFGFVHFETKEAANDSIARLNGMMLNGKKVFVGHFKKREERLRELGQSEERYNNVYVKNFPTTYSDENLKELFAQYGEIISGVVMHDSNGNPRGFGFVSFTKPDSAAAAVEGLNGKEMEGKVLYCGRAQKRAEREDLLRRRQEHLRMERDKKFQGLNLYIKNLDDTIDDDELRKLFSEYGAITSAKVMTDESGHSRGFGFVCFTTQEEATRAITEMNNRMVKGKPLYVALHQRKDARRAQLEAFYQRQTQVRIPNQAMPGQPLYAGQPVFYAPPNPGMAMPQQRQFMQVPAPMIRPGGFIPRQPGQQPGRPFQGGMPGQRQQRRGPQGAAQGGQAGDKVPKAGSPAGQMPVSNAGRRGGPQNYQKYPQQNQPRAQMPQEPLTAALLAAMAPEQQKQTIGERLYPLIHAKQPEQAGKITGMLLEMDNAELLHLLESPQALEAKVQEAIAVLDAHAKQPEGDAAAAATE
eukprot:Rmarinus@m.24564